MKHYGDITKIDGGAVPAVDVVTGGSPCQDLSVAGRRAGLQGERSGLFMEQIRVVKEMRAHDMADGRPVFLVRPRFMVWENVPGAFSSNGGKDFQAVLQEICRIVCEEAPAVPVPQNGWPKSGCLSGVGDTGCTFSIAWRLHDAQFWGVPQRRKRIALVADFGGLSAPEILFERKGLRGDSEPGSEEGQGTAERTESGVGGTISFQERAGRPGGAKESSCNMNTQEPCPPSTTKAFGISAYESNAMKSPNPLSGVYEADTSRTLDLNGGSPACNQGGGGNRDSG